MLQPTARSPADRQHVVIIGAGFGGLSAAKELANTAFDVALIGFRNRLVVAMNWAWNYVTFQRGTRLITGISGSRVENMARPEQGSDSPPLMRSAS